jgi:hypothetical protein
MFYRKYFAFVETTCPWLACCFFTWWSDRLFVEFGHRTTDSAVCTHNDLQYVHWHQAITTVAVSAQIIHSSTMRKKQFQRELALVGVSSHKPCLWHLYFVQCILCVAWASFIVCLIDVSPWLCIPAVLEYRASISLAAVGCVIAGLALEKHIWTSTLHRAVKREPNSIEI